MEFDIDKIEEILGYTFKNKELLKQSFTRRSYSVENSGENNEVLEFIGDNVLDMVVVKNLTGVFDSGISQGQFKSLYNENALTELKKKLVERKKLARRIEELDLAKYLIMGKGEIKNNAQEEDSVKEDLFEAIVGGVALDTAWDFCKIEKVVKNLLSIN
ncbi:MAG: hypothetical protein IJ301_01350 [Clostridia bacterium]|nr:hypothetical protein [Clostridia bacterium]